MTVDRRLERAALCALLARQIVVDNSWDTLGVRHCRPSDAKANPAPVPARCQEESPGVVPVSGGGYSISWSPVVGGISTPLQSSNDSRVPLSASSFGLSFGR
jgi:hypothetical protein